MGKQFKPQTGSRRCGIKVLATVLGLFFVLGLGISTVSALENVGTWPLLDSYHSTIQDGAVYVTSSPLTLNQKYNVIIRGTLNLWDMSKHYYLSTAEASPQIPSDNIANGEVGLDAEHCFSLPKKNDSSDAQPPMMAWVYFAVTGFDFYDPNPLECDPETGQALYKEDHVYTYEVIGAGEPLKVLIGDAVDYTLINNYGQLEITVVNADDPGQSTIMVPVDVKPTSCPNPYNVKSPGIFPVAILGTEDLDVQTIDPWSVKILLNGDVGPVRFSFEDVATPYEPFVDKPLDECACTTEGPDGYLDLTLKYNKKDILPLLGDVQDGQVMVLHFTGNFIDGGTFIGEDVIRIIKKK